ncbi:hypothetical protein ACHWQZ_G001636 [Mnemiopsis leidyi]
MFKGTGHFSNVTCPNDQRCSRPHCPFKHNPANSSPKKAPQPKPLRLASSSGHRKLPSYAPQNSPAEPKLTVDYKQLIRGCKNYKSPGKEPKPNNLFDKFRSPSVQSQANKEQRTRSPKKQKFEHRNELSTLGKEKSAQSNLLAPNNDRKSQHRSGQAQQTASSKKKSSCKPTLFEKFGGLKSSPERQQDSSHDTSSQDHGEPVPDELVDNEFPQYEIESNESKTDGIGLVYRPGIGITPDISGDNRKEDKKEKQSESILNSSLSFYDPYNNSTPTATSPSKSNFDETFDYQPFKPIDEPSSSQEEEDKEKLPSSQESVNASLVIEETSINSDQEEEVLLSDGEEEIISDDDEIPHLSEDDEPSDPEEILPPSKDTDVNSVMVKERKNAETKVPPNSLWSKDARPKVSASQSDMVFGRSELSPVKFKKTFQKKKSSPEVVEIIKDEEDKIMEAEFKKDLEAQTRKKLFAADVSDQSVAGSSKESVSYKKESNRLTSVKKEIEVSPVKSSSTQSVSADESDSLDSSVFTPQKSVKSGDESDEDDIDKKTLDREQKLEEIKLLKAKIFEKQWMQSKESSSSSSSSNSSSSDSSSASESETEDSSEGKTDLDDSDYTINSDASVKSEESEESGSETNASSQNSDSECLPKRKRKRLSSPLHSKENATKAKPNYDSTLHKDKLAKRLSKRDSTEESSRKAHSTNENKSSKNRLPNHRTIQIESTPSCKLKRKKEADSFSNNGIQEKSRKDKMLYREKEHRKQKRDSETKSHKRKHELKPGVSANLRSDQIIPHQRKLAKKKQRITDKYDARMEKSKEIDNSKTFYQRSQNSDSNLKISKYKKEDLSHFDPPTPPPDEDPHRWGNLHRKNRGKRVAHKPSDSHTKKKLEEAASKAQENKSRVVHPDGPRLDLKERTHVPVAIRQTRLDYFITEYLKVWPEDRKKCFQESLKAERSCLDRCKTKILYANICTNEVKKIRELKKNSINGTSETGISGSKKVGSVADTSKHALFHQTISKYKISKEDLKRYEYPGYYTYKPEVLDGLHCVRCSKLFQLEDNGDYTIPERCLHHNGKLRTRKSRGFKGEMERTRIYDCCDGTDGSTGCSVGKGHVYCTAYMNRDWKTYIKTKRRETAPSVWGLDCEMCYTAGGMELTRVTVVDISGSTALDMLIKPPRKVLDYNTRFSGIKAEDLANVEHTLEDAQRAVCRLISWDCFMVGHSLESDLHALKMIHKNVVDTSVVFFDGVYKRGLAVLSAEILGRIIQSDEGGHDSTEDALAALDLMKNRLKVADNVRL